MAFTDWIAERKIAVAMLIAYVVFVFSANITNLYAPNKDTSDKFYAIITPPGWAFAIWGVIFLLQGAAVVAALVPASEKAFAAVFDAPIAVLWCATAFLQSLWSFVVSVTVDFAAVLLVLSVFTTVAQQAYTLRKIAALDVSKRRALLQYVICVLPFTLHGGWTAAAAGLNVSLSAINHEMTPTGQLALAIGTLLWGFGAAWTFGVFGTPLSSWKSDPAYAGALIWALYAISSHETKRPERAVDAVVTFPPESIIPEALSRVAAFAATVLVAAVVVRGAVDTVQFMRADPSSGEAAPKGSQPLTA